MFKLLPSIVTFKSLKVVERIMYNHLNEFLESKNLIHALQFEFQLKLSTSHSFCDLLYR